MAPCAIGGLAISAAVWLVWPSLLPGPQVESSSRPDAQSCAECHAQQYADFQAALHAQTLRRLADTDLLQQFAGRRFRVSGSGAELGWSDKEGRLLAYVVGQSRTIPLDWAFGSGRHAMTPVAVWENSQRETELLEHRASWYPPGELHATLGLDGHAASNLEELGKWHAPAEAARCFGCHSTRVPQQDGRIGLDHLLPNVQCDRCHQGSQDHARAMRAGQSATGLVHWPALTSLQAIDRCGECHRRADEFSPDELHPESARLVRFAPVGLSLSACFRPGARQPARHADALTCVRCHDPHRPARSDADYYRQRCLECHDPQGGQRKPCPVQPATSLCTTCHMPKVALNAWLSFTDHWIRVREKDGQTAKKSH